MTNTVSEVVVKARMPLRLRTGAEAVFSKLGITSSAAVRIFYAETIRFGQLPFLTEVPRTATARALSEAIEGTSVTRRFDRAETAFAEPTAKVKKNAERNRAGKKAGKRKTT